MKQTKTPWTALVALVCTACAAPMPVQPWPELRQTTLELRDFDLHGRLVLRHRQTKGTARLRWQQRGEQLNLRSYDVLGRTLFALTDDGSEARLRFADGSELRAADAGQALRRSFGDYPVELCRYWILGVPAPQLPATERRFQRGLLSSFSQAGWQVSVAEHRRFAGYWLPTSLSLRRDEQQLQLRISRWTQLMPSRQPHR